MNDCITLNLNLPDVVVLGQQHAATGLVIEVAYHAQAARCPHCGRRTTKVHERRAQRKRDVPLRGETVTLLLWRRRFRCLWCRTPRGRARTFSEPDPVCGRGPYGRGCRSTTRLREQLGCEPPHQTVKRIAAVYQLSEYFVRSCFTTRATRLVEDAARKSLPRVIGVDEFALKRGHIYETIVCDLEAPCVREVLPGRAGAALQAYFESRADPDAVAVVVMDMSEAFRQMVQLCLPYACIVVDQFHVLQRVYKALDQVRLRLQRQADPFWKALLVRGRATLGRAPATWMDAERTVVETLLAEYPDLQHAWERADEFRTWYHSPDRATAARTLVRWEQAVQRDGVREYQMLLGSKAMLSSWRNEVLNYFDHRYTNSYCEGKNTRTKQLIRQAYGYRNRNNLRLRILLPAA